MKTAKCHFEQNRSMIPQMDNYSSKEGAPRVTPKNIRAKKTLEVAENWWQQIIKKYPEFRKWTKQAEQELQYIREAVKEKKEKFYYRNPKLRTKVLEELAKEKYEAKNILNLLDQFVPTETNKGVETIFQEFVKFMTYKLKNKMTPRDATKFVELKIIMERLQNQRNHNLQLPSTVKWTRTQTLFENYRHAIHTNLACHDGTAMFPINYENQREWDIFNRTVTLVGLLLNIPFTLDFLIRFMEHIQPILRERQEHCFLMMTENMAKQIQKISTIPFSIHKYKNPVMFFRGSNFDIHSVCPVPIHIVALNVENWSWTMENDILGAFDNIPPHMPPQPHLRKASHMATQGQLNELKTMMIGIPQRVSEKHKDIHSKAIRIENAFETELQWNAFCTNKRKKDPITMDMICSKLCKKPFFPKHEKVTLQDYLTSERNAAHLEELKQMKCFSCHKYGHSSRNCIYRMPEYAEYNLRCDVLKVTYNYIVNLERIKPLQGQLPEEVVKEFQRPLLWLLTDIFWSNLADALAKENLHINDFFDYYEKIRRRTAFGAGRQWALGATTREILRMIFGVIMPFGEAFTPFEYESAASQEEENEIAIVLKEKEERGFVAIGRRSQCHSMLSHKLVKETKKNRLIVRTFEYNDLSHAPKITMISPENMKAIRNQELMMIVDLDSSYDFIPISETCISRQGIYLKHLKKMYFLLGGLTGHTLLPAIHEISQAAWLFNCATGLTVKNPFMDDFMGAQRDYAQLAFKIFLENINESFLAISPKLNYEMSTTQTFLGKTYSTITSEFIPAEKHYISLLEKLYMIIFSKGIMTVGELFQIRGKILSMISNPRDIDSSNVDRLIAEAFMTQNVYHTEKYTEFMDYELSITQDMVEFILQSLETLLNFENRMETSPRNTEQDKIFIVTDAGDMLGGGMIIYHSKKKLPKEIQTLLAPYVITFDETTRKVRDTSSTSREQNILCSFLKSLAPLLELIKKHKLDPLVHILGDNKGVIARLKKGKTKNLAENLELNEIKEILKSFRVKAQWIRRTHDMIQVVDEIPRDKAPSFKPQNRLMKKILTHFKLKKIYSYANDEVVKALNPFTVTYNINKRKLKPDEAFYISINPRVISLKQRRNILLFLVKQKIRCILLLPENNHSQIYIPDKCPNLYFSYQNRNFAPSNQKDTNWIKAKRLLSGSAKFINQASNITTSLSRATERGREN